MSFKEFLLDYGEKVPGYDVGVINEREARAGAGILLLLGLMVIFVGIGFNHTIVARVYIIYLFFDFITRIINPSYSPSLLLGRMFVQNQTPEYVGAVQKRFAWFIGFLISIPMVWWFGIHWDISFYKVLICVLCITLMFCESVFAICLGCVLYRWIFKEQAKYCPGGVCEIRQKDPIQMFSPVQKIITGLMIIALSTGTYLFLAKVDSVTFFGQFLHEAVLTKAQLKAEADKKFEEETAAAFDDDSF